MSVGIVGRLETLADVALVARQVAYAFPGAGADERELIGRGMLELAAALDRFEQIARRSGWSGPVAELFPVERTVLP
jgi:hypothetical protein